MDGRRSMSAPNLTISSEVFNTPLSLVLGRPGTALSRSSSVMNFHERGGYILDRHERDHMGRYRKQWDLLEESPKADLHVSTNSTADLIVIKHPEANEDPSKLIEAQRPLEIEPDARESTNIKTIQRVTIALQVGTSLSVLDLARRAWNREDSEFESVMPIPMIDLPPKMRRSEPSVDTTDDPRKETSSDVTPLKTKQDELGATVPKDRNVEQTSTIHPAITSSETPKQEPLAPPPPSPRRRRSSARGGKQAPPRKPSRPRTKPFILLYFWMLWCDIWTKYAKDVLRFLALLLVFVYWMWLLFSFSQKKPVGDEDSFHPKKHGVIPKNVRLPYYEYDIFADPVDKKPELTIDVTIYGPFIPELQQNREFDDAKMAEKKAFVMQIVLERWYPKEGSGKSRFKAFVLDFEGGETLGTSQARLVMTEGTKVHEKNPLDYNNYPRKIRLTVGQSERKDDSYYAIGFGVDESQKESVPFSYQYTVDAVTLRTKVLNGLVPFIVFITFLLLEVNRAIAAMIAVATSVSSFHSVGLGMPTPLSISRWFDYDYMAFIFALLLLGILYVETNVHSAIAYHFLLISRMKIIPVLLFINIVPAILCVFVNNILITILLLPVVMRIFELMGHNPVPGIINTLVVCNLVGRAWVGTYASKFVLTHTQAINSKESDDDLSTSGYFYLVGPPTIFVTVIICLIYFASFLFVHPYKYQRLRQIEENEQLMRLCDLISASILDYSTSWHRIRLKIQATKAFFAFEIQEMRARVKKYGPEPEMSAALKLKERQHLCIIHNWWLLFKVITVLIFYLVLTTPYFYNIYMENFHDNEEMRLGYIGMFLAMATLLLVHSRDLEVLLKKVDWETLIVISCLVFLAQVFCELCVHVHDYLWKMYGSMMTGTLSGKVHVTLIQILALTAVSGVVHEFAVFKMFLDTAFTYAIFQGLNSFDVVLAGFILATGFWGIASTVGTAPNLVGTYFCNSQGYHHRVTLFNFMMWGAPTAFIAIVLLYFFFVFARINVGKVDNDPDD